MKIDLSRVSRILGFAAKEGRFSLLEPEVYQLLRAIGIQPPRYIFIKKGRRIGRRDLDKVRGDWVVLKIVSPLIAHKSDVGGVRIVKKGIAGINRAMQEMTAVVPGKFLSWERRQGPSRNKKSLSPDEIELQIRGFLICEKVDFEKAGLGEEMLLGVRNSREFGPVVTMGIGGVDVEYLSPKLKPGRASASASAHLLQKNDVRSLLAPLVFYGKMAAEFRGRAPLVSQAELINAFDRFRRLAAHFSPVSAQSPFVIEEAEVNPFVVRRGKLVPLDGLFRFSPDHLEEKNRPFENIRRILHPETIGIIGVSEKMNIGHVILNNILKNGFPRENVFVVKPGLREIEGCLCVPSVSQLPRTVDLFVLTLAAEQTYEMMKELVAAEKAHSVILIAGGLGEKKGTRELEAEIKTLLETNRNQGRLTPVVNGANCLGIYSRPAHYDTTFIPEHKFPRPSGREAGVVYLSQSGAFMLSRMSNLPHVVPIYAVSLGNQIDLTASDYLRYLKDDEEARTFALYIEGFHPGDGLALAKAISEVTRQEGKAVVVYKAGRTPEGRAATTSHTASVAGDFEIARAVLGAAGATVVETIADFTGFIKGLVFLAEKKVRGTRVGLISNAGFECVIMADNLKNDSDLTLARLSPGTVGRIRSILAPLGIDRLQDIRNPIDITPVGDDAVFCDCARALLKDDGVDCAVVSPVPMTPAMQTLAPSVSSSESIFDPRSTPTRLIDIFRKTDKPFVVNVDGGAAYDPMVDYLEREGVPTFRRCDDAVRFLREFINHGLKNKKRGGWG